MTDVVLQKGATYRGRIVIHAPTYMYSDATVREKLEGVGFSAITIWDEPGSLPSDWPSNGRSDVSGFSQSQKWVEGTWSKESGSYASSGSKWEMVDYWLQSPPPPDPTGTQPTCTGEGYSCDPSNSYCCQPLQCALDVANAFGGGNRCQQTSAGPTPTPLNKPSSGIGIGTIIVGGIVLAGLGGLAWWQFGRR